MIYLATPHTHPNMAIMHGRYELALLGLAALIQAGYKVYSPIAVSHPIWLMSKDSNHSFVRQLFARPVDFWYDYDAEIMSLCDKMIILTIPGWAHSKGVKAEFIKFYEDNKPYAAVDLNLLLRGFNEITFSDPAEDDKEQDAEEAWNSLVFDNLASGF